MDYEDNKFKTWLLAAGKSAQRKTMPRKWIKIQCRERESLACCVKRFGLDVARGFQWQSLATISAQAGVSIRNSEFFLTVLSFALMEWNICWESKKRIGNLTQNRFTPNFNDFQASYYTVHDIQVYF